MEKWEERMKPWEERIKKNKRTPDPVAMFFHKDSLAYTIEHDHEISSAYLSFMLSSVRVVA